MKQLVFVAMLAAAPFAQAQFLNQDIIRQAGENAATGNITLDNVQLGDGYREPARPAPTAGEIAAEIRAQEQHERFQRQAEIEEGRRRRVVSAIERAYKAEFKK